MDYVQQLIEMGFQPAKAKHAVNITNNTGLEPALEWLLAYGDDKTQSEPEPARGTSNVLGSASTSTAAVQTPLTSSANSFKCDDCGKLCATHSEVEFHASKTGHQNFSESREEKKPLTDEEKKRQLAMIDERLKRKRDEREKQEQEDAIEREKKRIQSGKDMEKARKRMLDNETQKSIDQLKQQKAEELAAKERVRAQIAADKDARKPREEKRDDDISTVDNSKLDPSTSAKSDSKNFTETRIQIRLLDGSTISHTFDVKEPLSAVRVFLILNSNTEEPFSLMTSYPRKIFKKEDYEKQLDTLDLVPSAVIIVTRAAPN